MKKDTQKNSDHFATIGVLKILRKRLTYLIYEQACCAGCRRRPFIAEAPPIGKINPFNKIAKTFKPVMQFECPSRYRISFKIVT